MALESAPFLVFGLGAAGLLVWLLPQSRLGRWLSGSGPAPVVKAALMGIPFPLCSCSVVPVATGLLRGGASPGATLSFLISTPENGADSLALSYVLLGPVMTVARPLAALCSGVTAGLLAPSTLPQPAEKSPCGCCGGKSSRSLKQSMTYAFSDMLQDLVPWLSLGLVIAALMACLLQPTSLAAWGSGLGAKLLMVVLGVPMYICASASTPVAASLLAAGMSPGTVLVFLLAGPATNLGTLAIVHREMGMRSLSAYLVGACLVPVVCGSVLDALTGSWTAVVGTAWGQPGSPSESSVVSWLCLLLLIALTVYHSIPVRRTRP